jgi:hypothetical protein
VKGFLPQIPSEPYGGEYRFDPGTREVSSSTHAERMRVYRSSDSMAKQGDIE